jgi:hypothetical protein
VVLTGTGDRKGEENEVNPDFSNISMPTDLAHKVAGGRTARGREVWQKNPKRAAARLFHLLTTGFSVLML